MSLLYLLNVLAAGIGFYIAYNIYCTKILGKGELTCSIDHDCHSVVHSKYAKTFGIENAVLGLLYYAFVILSYLVVVFYGEYVFGINLRVLLLYLTAFAVCFSSYLFLIMRFKLKQWCDWCLGSISICFLIFCFSLYLYFR